MLRDSGDDSRVGIDIRSLTARRHFIDYSVEIAILVVE